MNTEPSNELSELELEQVSAGADKVLKIAPIVWPFIRNRLERK